MKKNLLSGQFALVVLVLAVVAVDVQMLTVARHTLAPLPAVLAVSALVAAALYLPLRRMWRRLVGGSVWIAFAAAVVAGGSLLSAAFLNVNYYGADFDSMPVVEAQVIGKRCTERPVMRRVSRRTYVRAGERPVYEVTMEVGGYRVTLEEPFEKYRLMRNGSAVGVRCGRGPLGLKVMRLQ